MVVLLGSTIGSSTNTIREEYPPIGDFRFMIDEPSRLFSF